MRLIAPILPIAASRSNDRYKLDESEDSLIDVSEMPILVACLWWLGILSLSLDED